MKHYRVREGSFIDHARFCIAGLAFWIVLGLVAVSVYPG